MDGKQLGELPVSAWGEHGTRLGGLSLRQHFAGLAMQGLIAQGGPYQTHTADGVLTVPGRVAVPKLAVEYADALLAELAKERT